MKQKAIDTFHYFHGQRLFHYIGVGVGTVFIDMSILFLLHEVFNMWLWLSLTLAYWTSISFNFFFNRTYTFNHRAYDGLKKHSVLYILLLGFNYLFTLVFVTMLSHIIYFAIAKLIAIAVQTLWTFLIYKRFIFR